MNLRRRISTVAILTRLAGVIVVVAVVLPTGLPALYLAAPVVWLILSRRVLRQFLLPAVFPDTQCPGCGRSIPLFGVWKCGGHYTDHREQHILSFLCVHGHRLESFDCPRCRATIVVQGGDRKWLRHGSGLRLRSVSQLPHDNGLLLGHDERGCPICLPDDRLAWHMALAGGTGRGKSTLLGNMAVQLIERGDGLTLLDPGGDLARAVLGNVPEERQRDVLYLDVSNRRRPFAMNILSAADELEQAVLCEELLGVFHRLYGAAWGPLLSHQLRMALLAVIKSGGTLRDVYGMFGEGRVRARIIARLPEGPLRAFWTEEFPAIPAMRRTAVTNKLAPIVFHPILAPIICAHECALDADEAIRSRQIVLVNLASGSPGDDVTTLLGTFLVQKIIAAAFRQGNRPPAGRVPHVLIVDEFQRFMHRAAAFDQILAEARKFRLALIVANQYVEQLAPAVRAALFGNVGCLTAFRVGHRDAKVLVSEFSGAIADDLMEQGRGECLIRIGTDWTKVRTPPPIRVAEPTEPVEAPEPVEPTIVEAEVANSNHNPNEDELVE